MSSVVAVVVAGAGAAEDAAASAGAGWSGSGDGAVFVDGDTCSPEAVADVYTVGAGA